MLSPSLAGLLSSRMWPHRQQAAREDRDPGVSLESQAYLAPSQGGFLDTLTHSSSGLCLPRGSWLAQAAGSAPCTRLGAPRMSRVILDLQGSLPCRLPNLDCLCQALVK